MARELKAERRSARTPLRACAIRVNASGEHTHTANAHHASRTHIRGETKRKALHVHTGRNTADADADGACCIGERKSVRGMPQRARWSASARLRRREAHTTRRRHGAHHACSDSCTYASCMMCSRGARRLGAQLPMPVERSGQGEGRSQADTPSGGRASCTTPLWRVRKYGGGASARTSIVHRASHTTTRSSPHAVRRVRGQAGMHAHADDEASCEVLYGGADADAGAEAGSLALRPVRVCA
jgi:hypothetical protein